MARLSLDLLGPMVVRLDGQTVTSFESVKVRALLAYLTVEANRPHPRDGLAGLLWPDWPQRSALSNLRYALSDLRQAIGDRAAQPPFLLVSRDTIQFNLASDHGLDVTVFAQVIEGKDAGSGQLSQATALYRGLFLDGLSISDCPGFEDWVRLKREQCERLLLEAWQRLAEAHGAQGDYETAVRYARQLTERDPWNEAGHQQLMRWLALSGQRNAALAQYGKLRRELASELGVEPQQQTQALQAAIKAGTVGSGPSERATPGRPGIVAPRHNLPAPTSSFIGREAEVEGLLGLLMSPTSRLVMLTGPGGVGKTRLTLQVAQRLLENFPDGVWLAQLAPLADPVLVPQVVAGVLGVREDQHRPLVQALDDHLRTKNLLLILDNCEHLVEAVARMAQHWLQAAPRLRILASSREALGIAGETNHPVPSLTLPEVAHLPPVERLAEFEAVALFSARAEAVQPGFQLTSDNAAAVAHICCRLDGIPLAIELAAARTRAMRVDEVAARLDDRFHLLTKGSRTALPRHQTLRALIDWSYELLSRPEQMMLRRLAVFAGGFTLEAAEQVGAGDGLEAGEVLDLLAGLVNKSLVNMDGANASQPPRYRLLETIRAYALGKLLEAGEADTLGDRHLDHYTALAEEAWPHLFRAEQLGWLARLEAEHNNLRTALGWGLQRQPLAAVQMGANLWMFWSHRGHWSEGIDWLKRSLKATEGEVPGPAKSRAMVGLAFLTLRRHGLRQAHALYQEALAVARAVGDLWCIARMFDLQASWEIDQGNLAQADAKMHEALKMYEQYGDPWGQVNATQGLAFLAVGRGQVDAAVHFAEKALTMHATVGERDVLTGILKVLSTVAALRGDHTRAIRLGQRRLAVARELGGSATSGMALFWLATLADQQGDYAQAKLYLDESLAASRELGRAGLTNMCLVLLGSVASQQGDCGTAETYFEAALKVAQELDEKQVWVDMFIYGGLAAYNCGDLPRATEQLTRGWGLVRETGFAFEWNQACYGLAKICYYRGDFDQARQYLEEGLVKSRAGENAYSLALLLLTKGRLDLRQENMAQAQQAYRESLSLWLRMEARPGIAEALECLAGLAAHNGQAERAARQFGAAQALREQIGAPLLVVEQAEYQQAVTFTRSQLDTAVFEAAWAEGRAMAWEQAAAYALEPGDSGGQAYGLPQATPS